MTGKRLSMNILGSRPTIMASKIATGTSMNARQQNDSITHELSRAMQNVREWKSVTTIFSSPHANCLDGLSISLWKLEVPFCTFQSQKRTFFHIYAPYQLDNKRIHRLLYYNPCTLGLVLKIKNCVGFPCHVMRSMILDLLHTGNSLTQP
jgi:hypothetical protein